MATSYDQFTPRNVKFSDIYKHTTQSRSVPNSAKKNIYDSMVASGLDKDRASRILHNDEKITVAEMKKVSKALSGKVDGFYGSGTGPVNSYLRKAAIRSRNIDRVKHDIMLESRREDIGQKIKTSLNNKNNLKKLF